MSSWKLTKKLKETNFLRGHNSSTASSANSSDTASPEPAYNASGASAYSYDDSSRANTITESSRGTITAKSPGNGGAFGASSGLSGSGSTSANSTSHGSGTSSSGASGSRPAQRSAARTSKLLRIKIYELRGLNVDAYLSSIPAWALEKSSTKPPPVYIVLEYDKTQILLHAIGGTVEDPVWDKTTTFDVVANVPLNLSVYLKTADTKKNSIDSERDRRSSSEHHVTSEDEMTSSVTSSATARTKSGSSTSNRASRKSGSGSSSSGNGASNGNAASGDSPVYSQDERIHDVLLDSTRIEIPQPNNRTGQLRVAGGVLSFKCELHNTRNQSLSIDDFTLLKVIGKGSFGKVMQVCKKDTCQVYALKTIRKAHIVSKSEVGHTLAERTVLAKINNPFIVPLKFSFQSPEKLYLVLAFVNGGELFHHLQREGRFDLNRARFYTAELLCALECLHEYNVIYRDLKPENILLDYTGHIALCDFGLCKLNMGSQDHTSTFCGTPEYLAPELLLGQGYTKAVDWWTLGVLFYEMLTGLPPFYDQNTNTMYHKIVKDPLTFPADMDREAKSLISLLLERDPTKRLGVHGAAEIKAHPFFHQIDWKYLINKKYAAPFLPSVSSATDTSNFDSEFTREKPMDSVVDKQFHLSDSVQQQFGGWSYTNESKLASSGKW